MANLTGPPQPTTLDQRVEELGGAGLLFTTVVRTLREESAAELLADLAAGRRGAALLPWIPLLHGADGPAIIAQWRGRAEAEPSLQRRAEYGGLALVFAELADRRAAWEAGLKGYNMKTSAVANEWRAEGRTEGRTEGRAEGRQSKVLRLLERRFGDALPDELRGAVIAEADLERLDRWFDAAIDAKSLAEFRTLAAV